MKRLTTITIMVALMLAGGADVMAQYRTGGAGRSARSYHATHRNRQDYYHFGYASASLGYNCLLEGAQGLTPIGGVGNQLGAGYEFRYHNFWLSVGGQASWLRSKAAVAEYKIDKDLVWPNAIPHDHMNGGNPSDLEATGHYMVSQIDSISTMLVDIPLMLGFYYQGFYVGAGAKMGFGLNSHVYSRGTYTLTATSPRYDGDYNLGSNTFKSESPISFKPQVSIIGEIGFDVLSVMETRSPWCHVLKVGFYFEVGCNSIVRVPEKMERMMINGQDAQPGMQAVDVAFKPYMSSGYEGKGAIAPFYTGLKVTYMFGGNKNSNHGVAHRGCQCYE